MKLLPEVFNHLVLFFFFELILSFTVFYYFVMDLNILSFLSINSYIFMKS